MNAHRQAATAARLPQTQTTAAPRLICPVTRRTMRRALSAREIVLLAFYMKCAAAAPDGSIWPSIVRTAHRFNWTPQDVSHITRRLIERGMIEPLADMAGKPLRKGKARLLRVVKSHNVSLCDSHNLPLASPSYAELPQLPMNHHRRCGIANTTALDDDMAMPVQSKQETGGRVDHNPWPPKRDIDRRHTPPPVPRPAPKPQTVPPPAPTQPAQPAADVAGKVAAMLKLRGTADTDAERMAANAVEWQERRKWTDSHGVPIGSPIMATVKLIESNRTAFAKPTRQERTRRAYQEIRPPAPDSDDPMDGQKAATPEEIREIIAQFYKPPIVVDTANGQGTAIVVDTANGTATLDRQPQPRCHHEHTEIARVR